MNFDDTLWNRIRDKIPYGYRMECYFDNLRLAVKSWWQRRTKGYANSECWNLEYSTAEWILPRLKHFRNNLHSIPPNLERGNDNIGHSVEPELIEKQNPEDRFDLTLDEWKSKLDKMIYAFEFILTEDDIIGKCYPADYNWGFTTKPCEDRSDCREFVWKDSRNPDYTYYNECQKRYEEGIKLFALYYRHLWD